MDKTFSREKLFISSLAVASFNAYHNGFSPGQFGADVAFCGVDGGLMDSGVGWGIGFSSKSSIFRMHI